MRLNQYVASASGLSRRAADTAIAEGRVTIDGQLVGLGQQVPDGAEVCLDGKPLALPTAFTYVLFHKPVGYVTSRTQQGTDPTIYELLPDEYHMLRPVGRLDRDSSGLLILTDDGSFILRHTHPSFAKMKQYELKLARPLTATDAGRLETGVILGDGPSRVQILDNQGRRVLVALGEGRNRQLRRTFGLLGYTVEGLHRLEMGAFSLGGLTAGKWRILEPGELA
jgi:pseudouridine synthase